MAPLALPLVEWLVTIGVSSLAAFTALKSAQAAPSASIISSLTQLVQSAFPYKFVKAERQLADQLAVAIQSPAGQAAAEVSAAEASQASAEVVDTILAHAAAPARLPTLDTFYSVAQADAWLTLVQDLMAWETMSEAGYSVYADHYHREVARLTEGSTNTWIAAAQALAAGIPSPSRIFFIGLALARAGQLNVPNAEAWVLEGGFPQVATWGEAWDWWQRSGRIVPLPVPPPAAPPAATPAPPAATPGGALTIPGLDALPGLAGSLAGLVGALPQALAGAMTGAANLTNAGRARQHRDRLECVDTTAGTLFQQLGGKLLSAAAPFALLAVDTHAGAARGPMGRIVNSLAQRAIPTGQMTPDNVDAMAMDLLVDRTTFSAAAHLLAQAAEVNANIKTLNTGYIAAFLANLSGYASLARSWLGQVEVQGIQPAMARRINRITQSQIPRLNDLAMLYAKKEASPKLTENTLAELGYSKEWRDIFASSLFLDPRQAELVRIGQMYAISLAPETRTPTPMALSWLSERGDWLAQAEVTLDQILPDWYWWYKLMKGGYEMTDVKVLVQVIKRAVVRREQTLFFNAVLRLYRDGFITRPRSRELVEEGWGVGKDGDAFLDPLAARMRAMDLQVEYNRKSMVVSTVGRMLAKGLIDDDEGVRLMVGQGMAEDVAVARLVQAKLGLLRTQRLEMPDEDRDTITEDFPGE